MEEDLDELEDDDEESPLSPPTVRSAPGVALGTVTARGELDELQREIRLLMKDVRRKRDASLAHKASVMRLALQSIRLLGQFTGEVGASELAVASSPYVQRMLREIREALKPHPEALLAVVARVDGLEAA